MKLLTFKENKISIDFFISCTVLRASSWYKLFDERKLLFAEEKLNGTAKFGGSNINMLGFGLGLGPHDGPTQPAQAELKKKKEKKKNEERGNNFG